MAPPDDADVLREQRAYYAARAAEYDDSYRRTGQYDRGADANADWRAELERAEHAFDGVPITGDVVELAAGTGHWTERLVRRARSLTVIDGSAETLAVNRDRLGSAAAGVDFQVADLFEWQPPRVWDACVFCFWICHVPDARLADFLHTVAASIRHGGIVCFVDKPTAAAAGRERVRRTLGDGRGFTIFDSPRPGARLIEAFATAGLEIEVDALGDRFCVGHGTRR